MSECKSGNKIKAYGKVVMFVEAEFIDDGKTSINAQAYYALKKESMALGIDIDDIDKIKTDEVEGEGDE